MAPAVEARRRGGARSRPVRRGRLAIVSCLWLLLLVTGSLLPLRVKTMLGTVGSAHEVIHAAAFGGTAMILMLWGNNKFQEASYAAIAIAVGVILEIAQQQITGDVLEVTDIATDLLGVLLALGAFQFASVRSPLHAIFRRL